MIDETQKERYLLPWQIRLTKDINYFLTLLIVSTAEPSLSNHQFFLRNLAVNGWWLANAVTRIIAINRARHKFIRGSLEWRSLSKRVAAQKKFHWTCSIYC